MKSVIPRRLHFVVCVIFLIASLLPCAAFAQNCEQWIAQAVSVEGNVEVQRAGETSWQTVKLNDAFCPGDTIRVDDQSRAALSLTNQPLLRLDQNTTITLGGVEEKRGSIISLAKGALHFFSRIRRNLEVQTGFVNAGVEGTEGFIRVEQDRTLITIYDGKVLASNAAGSLTLVGGQSAVAEAGKAPVGRVVVRPRDAVQWALYYPPVMLFAPGKEPKEDEGDPHFLAYRASQLLAVGRSDEAAADIQKALSIDPKYSDAYALQAVIFVVQNEKEKALASAKKAVETGPTSATAQIALSYAQQASFDLEGARASVEKAVNLDAYNALAWARLAELWSSFGYLNKSLKAAKKAVDLDPELSRTQMVLGFAYLTEVKITESQETFEKAIALDSADPLSRLGLGLAKIRDGDLDAGGREIEIAASLDPNNSIVRSYMGKTYFEEKKTGLDEREYAIAKELDPKDPTPWFYDAIAKQTTNRPVEALRNIQKARELNDNRAVYRSKLLLDSDLAARSAATARIYSDLGYQQRALVEGWSSLNSDPANYSAHRFLADSYSVLPRREIARVSELLQSQLLQPTNITPIQPRLAESNLFLDAAQGPGGLSFNEFNPIFNRNRLAVQGTGLAGENDTYGGEGVVSGIYDKLSFSGGYSYFDTNGWYKNANQTDKIANVFAQYEFTPKTSVQAEYRYRDDETGDINMHYWEDNRLSAFQDEVKTSRIRFGARHAFSPGSILLGNFQYSDGDTDTQDLFFFDNADFGLPPPPVEDSTDDHADDSAYSGELQYLLRSQYFDAVSGAGYFYIDQRIDFSDTLVWPGPPPINFGKFKSRLDQDTKHFNVYLYSHIKPVKSLMLTLGGSGDFYDADDKDNALDLDRNKFNPKFGVSWYPFEGTTVRGAVFKTFKRTLITDQTLEPTQVAGFNQFYDDGDATEAWVYGVGADQKFTESIYAGAEFFYRDLSVPYFSGVGNLETKDASFDEYIGRAYIYYTPHDWLALRAEYGYEKIEYTENVNLGAEEVKTHSVPLGVNFFHPSGLFAGIKGTFYYQDGKFEKFDTATYKNANNSFYLVDAAIGYRLPKRYGIITAGVTNLFDEDDFNYWETDPKSSRIQPDRQAFIKCTLALP